MRSLLLPTSSLRGFTLIEILIVIGLISILASVVLIAINPARQFAQARNSQRVSNVNAILNAIGIRIAENRGLFAGVGCTTQIPDTPTPLAKDSYNIRPCLVPTYIPELPFDPSDGNNTCANESCTAGSYSTGYTISRDPDTGRITICAPNAAESSIEGSTPYCLTR